MQARLALRYRRLVTSFFFLSCFSAQALAEVSGEFTDPLKPDKLNRQNCENLEEKATFTVDIRETVTRRFDIELWRTEPGDDATCPREPDGQKLQKFRNINLTPSYRITQDNIQQGGLTLEKLLPDEACTEKGDFQELALCVYLKSSSSGLQAIVGQKYGFDTRVLRIDKIRNIEPSSEEISFNAVANKSNILRYETCYGEGDKSVVSGDACPKTMASSSASITVGGLTNNQMYAFKVRAIDTFGNESPYTKTFTETPIPLVTPLELYDGPENPLSFSCAQTTTKPSSMLPFIAAFLVILVLRTRTKKTRLAVFFLSSLFLAAPLLARPGAWNISLQVSPYLPNIDGTKKADGSLIFPIYKCFYRGALNDDTGRWLPLLGLDASIHIFDGAGTLEVGWTTTYTHSSGKAQKANNGGQILCNEPVGTSVGLHMFQLRPHITYIFDQFIEDFPIAPYFRLGLVGQGYIFTFKNGLDTQGLDNPVKTNPIGVVFGYEAQAGILFLLDILEPRVATNARSHGAYEHSFLQVGLSYMPINNFHSQSIDLSPTSLFGLPAPLLFTFGLLVQFQ